MDNFMSFRFNSEIYTRDIFIRAHEIIRSDVKFKFVVKIDR